MEYLILQIKKIKSHCEQIEKCIENIEIYNQAKKDSTTPFELIDNTKTNNMTIFQVQKEKNNEDKN